MARQQVLIDGGWRSADSVEFFRAFNPATGETLADEYPISAWTDCETALEAAAKAAVILRDISRDAIGQFLNGFARRIEARASEIVEMAHIETALPKSPRLATIELPRTTGQLRQAATAAIEGSWALPTLDTKLNIRSFHAAIGPVCVLGPNNFPLAFNGISGGDFAAAIAAGNPVIAKAHPCHPGTTRLLGEEALAAVGEAGLPPATVQLIYHLGREDGLRLVADARVGATGFTGSRTAGLALKASADAVGKLIYLEMSSLNPVVILPGALEERADKLVDEYADSCLAASGQFCTKPGLLILLAGERSENFLLKIGQKFTGRAVAPLLSAGVGSGLGTSVKKLLSAGAEMVVGGTMLAGETSRFTNTLLRVDGDRFLANPQALQTEAFGNAGLAVLARDGEQAGQILESLEGQLTGCICSSASGVDDQLYAMLSPILRRRVGRLLNDKMPTGVAVSPAMNHGGPYPATGHPGFTAVGIAASLRRFSQLECYDNVRQDRLPAVLRDRNSNPGTWRLIDGQWTQGNVTGGSI
jgi:NADP-dependent aldehyde dehydrogenase